jgi:hypothetical protein
MKSAEGFYIFIQDENGNWVQQHENPITEEALAA